MTPTERSAIEAGLAERLAASAFHASMGIALVAVRDDGVDLRMHAGAEHANLHGTVHGGVLATLADTAAGVAVRAMHPDPAGPHATVTLDVQYLAAARAGELTASGRVVKLGRRIAFADAEITDADGVVVARATSTIAIAQPEGPGTGDPEAQ
jgi:uncharacterized protein (TIGR00369 family)